MKVSTRRLAGGLPGADRLRRIGDRFVRVRVEPDLAHLSARIDDLESMRALVDEHETSRHEHWARLGVVAEESGRLRADLGRLRFDVERLIPVVAALEERVERMQRSVSVLSAAGAPDPDVAPGSPDVGALPGSPATGEVAGHLLAEIRREHAQVRARLSAVAAYEERLRRLEVG